MKKKSIIALALAALMVFALLAGCARKQPETTQTTTGTEQTVKPEENTGKDRTPTGTEPENKPADTKPADEKEPIETFLTKTNELKAAESYEEIKKAIDDQLEGRGMYGGMRGVATSSSADFAVEEAAAADTAAPQANASSAKGETGGMGGGADYSETNVQVKGVDEGDIVKTDGEYIYILRERELSILRADGAGTAEVSVITVADEDTWSENGGSWSWSQELYVKGDRLIVIRSESSWSNKDKYESTEKNAAVIYDISDKTAPKLIGNVAQEGNGVTSRLVDDTLYLVSTYYVYDYEENGEGDGYIPRLFVNGAESKIAAGDICILPYFQSTAYTVVSAIDVDKADMKATQCVLGSGGTVYMNADNLYIAGTRYDREESEPYTSDQYQVTDYVERRVTDLVRFDISGGTVKTAASGTVSGGVLNQFSMDEKDGYLRIVTTIDENRYSIYRDEKYGFENYKWDEEGRVNTNSLYVLDGDFALVGSVEELAEDERVYSVRFDGDIGYFVTFRQVDPLFAVDLSDPTNPTVLSSLKIPGFSEYLHVFGEGRLLGLGMAADEDGRTECMKLSMFDVSDPKNVTEISSLKIEDIYWSEALYNHKAILVDKDKDLIAFPAEGEYHVYGYSEQGGFYLRETFEFPDMWVYNSRGLYIGDYIYICSPQIVQVFTLDGFDRVAEIDFAKG